MKKNSKKKEIECSKDIFKNYYISESFKKVYKFSEIAIKNARHILLTGKEGVGITSIEKLIEGKHSNNQEKDFTFVFTEKTTIGDLTGKFILSSSKKYKENLIEWKNGPLTDAIQSGYSGLFLNIDSTDNKILERIICLLDQKETEKGNIFKIPENPNLESVKIDPNYLFYCTCS